MDSKQAAKIAARKSNTEGPQYVVWVFDQGREIFDREQMRRYAPLVHVEAVYIGGADIPQEVEAYAEGRADEREAIAQLCDEEAANIRKEGDGCKDARYDWMAQGVEALADTLRGISSATGKPADPVLAAGWLPIESAPEDENVLVATEGGHVDCAFWTDDSDGPKWWWLVSANEYAKHPLHPNLIPLYWMPLPKHPHRVATTIGKLPEALPCTHSWQVVQYGATYHALKCSMCGETKRETWD